jgi:DNA-binding winged helix-turn-helix (wHTH) protein
VQARAELAAEERLITALTGEAASADTRGKFRRMLRAGELEGREIEINLVEAGPSPIGQFDMPGMPPGQMINLGEMMKGIFGGRPTPRKLTVAAAREALQREEADKLRSYDVGIDDYVTKPFSPKELIARIRAILRRSGAPESGQIQYGKLTLDIQSHRLAIDGESTHIGPTEFRLLEFLMRHPERAFDREHLLDRVWGRSVYVEERTVDVHILRLRKILQPHGLSEWVETVRGVGYRFSPKIAATATEAP